jgi:hypothetical protein
MLFASRAMSIAAACPLAMVSIYPLAMATFPIAL